MKIILLLSILSFNLMAETIYITGSIESKNTQHVLMPLVPNFNGKISEMVEEGKLVKKGEFLLKIDGSSIDSQIEAQIEQLDVFKATVKQQSIDLKIQLNQTQIAYESAKIRHQITKVKAETPLNYIGELAFKQNQLAFKNADKLHQKASNDLKEVKTKIVENQQEITLGITQKQNKLNYLKDMLSRFTIYAQQDGYVIYSTKMWTGEKIQVGDQLNSGMEILSVSQNSDLQIIAWVNAIDIPKITTNQALTIQFDAFLNQSYKGKIQNISSGGQDKQIWGDALYYKTIIEITDKVPNNLLIGMSALMEVVLKGESS